MRCLWRLVIILCAKAISFLWSRASFHQPAGLNERLSVPVYIIGIKSSAPFPSLLLTDNLFKEISAFCLGRYKGIVCSLGLYGTMFLFPYFNSVFIRVMSLDRCLVQSLYD